jgi:uncharacterized protein
MLQFQDFISLFLSIVLEAFPFVVLGVLLSVIIALFVPQQKLLRFIPKNRFLSHLTLSLSGMLLPVCECGNVPVARRLLKKGFSVSHATTFLLAAPIINPITFITTWTAFSPDYTIALYRIGAGLIIVNVIGIWLSYRKDQATYLTKKFLKVQSDSEEKDSKFVKGLHIFQTEFLLIMSLLCFGALIAAGTQVFIPKDAILAIGQSGGFSILAMMLLAFVISVCSTVDAFIALSYANTFTIGSLMAFMLFGPMMDIKMLVMMKSIYTTKFLLMLIYMIAIFSFAAGLAINVFR